MRIGLQYNFTFDWRNLKKRLMNKFKNVLNLCNQTVSGLLTVLKHCGNTVSSNSCVNVYKRLRIRLWAYLNLQRYTPCDISRRPSRRPKIQKPRRLLSSEAFHVAVVIPLGFEPRTLTLKV